MALSRYLLAVPVLAFTLGLAVGCDEPEALEGLDASALDERFACDDLTLVAASSDGEHALLVGIDDGLVATTLATGMPIETLYELPDERLMVRWVSGTNVYQGHCGRDSGEPWTLDERTDAIAGVMAIRVVPIPGQGLRLEAEFRDVILTDNESEDDPELYLDLARFADVIVD